MARDVDDRKKRAALRKLRRAAARALEGKGPPLSDWENRFLEEVDARIESYGSAFHDYAKGASEEALSDLQRVKLKEIDAKTRGKVRKPLGAASRKVGTGFRKNAATIQEPGEAGGFEESARSSRHKKSFPHRLPSDP